MKALVVSVMLLFVGSANAAIIYDLDRTIGAGSVTGTITTDGTLGSLATSNFIDWELLISDGAGSFTLFGPGTAAANSNLLLTSSSFIATLTDLIFDFDAPGIALFQNPSNGSGVNWWCLDGTLANCAGTGDGSESVHVLSSTEYVLHSGEVTISTTSTNPVSVSEPGPLALVGLGLLGLALSRRKVAR